MDPRGELLVEKHPPPLLAPVAVEQGRFLTTPELVPFRLTRDIVDGMGSPGLEGPLRRWVR
jgi:phosphatidylinositol kinase/protein kinase (PI-3  family)